jgi:magnesium chelatase subunit I
MIHFPFVAVVGMEDAKKSLLYHAIDPRIGGTLLLGHRGCAKSTLVRGFAEILGGLDGSAPFVELPLGATEDRLLGSVNAESLVEEGRWKDRRGLIEEAHGGVLYVDEINLLPDHLADFLLDSAATGHHRVERDGVSRGIESRYILIGTMNPEEGDLRPQLADRFAHGIRIADDFAPEQRMEIVARRMQFDDEPEEFVRQSAEATAEMKARIADARERVRQVTISHETRVAVAGAARELKLEGLRAELAVLRTARCAAAWNQRGAVGEEEIREAWHLCLGHRHEAPPAMPPRPDAPPPKAQSLSTETTPRSPLDARHAPRPIVLIDHEEPSLQEWFSRNRAVPRVRGAPRASGIRVSPTARIAWISSLLASLPARILKNQPGWRLRYFSLPRPSAWLFLDASRSTGAGQFLSRACAALGALGGREKAARFHLLILQHGSLRWLARRRSRAGLQKALLSVQEAGGKSLIVEGLEKIRRARSRHGAGGPVIICSDGLATPAPGGQPGHTFTTLRRALHRVARAGAPIAWLHPAARRAFADWLPRLCRSLPIARFEAGTKTR